VKKFGICTAMLIGLIIIVNTFGRNLPYSTCWTTSAAAIER
jgi:hypothetical protein